MRKAPISIVIFSSLMILACQATVTNQPDPNANNQITTDIRPGSKGQKLEFTDLEAEVVIPAGTSAYSIQSASQIAFHQQILGDLNQIILPAAYAQEAANGVSEADQAITQDQITALKVSVDGLEVAFDVLAVQDQADGSQNVLCRLKKVPVSEENTMIEFSSKSGSFQLSAVISKIGKDLKKLRDKVTIETTAVAILLEQDPDRDKDFSESEIRQLAKTEDAHKLRDKIYDHLVKGPKGKKLRDAIKDTLAELKQKSIVLKFVDERRFCKKNPDKCTQTPVLPRQFEKAIPKELVETISFRLQLRQGRPATEEEKAKLLELGPIARRAACLERRINPCPGLPLRILNR